MNVPKRVVANSHFASYLDTSDEWIQERTGIAERRWIENNESASELAEPAARAAVEMAGLNLSDIDGIIFATVTPDHIFPSTASCLQRRLGCTGGLAFDVNAVCAGFIYAFATADALIRTGLASNILVVGSDIYSRILDYQDRGTCILFGDGAGACVLSRIGTGPSKVAEGSGVLGSKLRADGSYTDILCVPAGSAKPWGPGSFEAKDNCVHMAGKEVFKLAVRHLAEVSEQLITELGYKSSDVNWIVAHQANKRILDSVTKHLGTDPERMLMNVEKYGNTSAASVPILFCEAVTAGTIKRGDLVLINAFGGGVSWGASLIRY